jgi:hypothetical protein
VKWLQVYIKLGCPKPHECTSQFLDPVKDDAGKPVNVFLAASRPAAEGPIPGEQNKSILGGFGQPNIKQA